MIEKTYILHGESKLPKYIQKNLPLRIGLPDAVGKLESEHVLKIEGEDKGRAEILEVIYNLTNCHFTELTKK